MRLHLLPFAFFIFLLTGSAFFLSGCSKHSTSNDTQAEKPIQKANALPAGPSTLEAARYLGGLLLNDQLPDTQDAKSHVTVPSLKKIATFSTNYPLERSFTIGMMSSSFVNHYKLVKETPDGSWKIKQAWRTDADGKTVKEYAIQ
jgi:hypothetical protein